MGNTHTYTVSQTITEPLPTGRFLIKGEAIVRGDLILHGNEKAKPFQSNLAHKAWDNYSLYRVEQEVKPTVTYRFLNKGEGVAEGDECNFDKHFRLLDNWVPASNYLNCYVSTVHAKYQNFRRPIKATIGTPKNAKYRMLQPDEVIQKGDQHYYVSTRGWRNVGASIGYTVKSWPILGRSTCPSRRFRRKIT